MYSLQNKVDTLIKYWVKFVSYDVEFKTWNHDVTLVILDIPMVSAFDYATAMFENVIYCPQDDELRFEYQGHYFRYDGIALEIAQSAHNV